MQTRTVGLIIATALLVVGLAGCRNLPRGGLGRGPDVRTIAGVGLGPERLAVQERAPSTISSRVDPPDGQERPGAVVGQVVDDRGVPVANARVRLAVDGSPGGREVVGTTNRSGQFLLKGLRPGDEYMLIAEWDDGREFLLGRSAVSAPAEKIRIQVASIDGPDRSSIALSPREESSRTASFSRDDRDLEPASIPEELPASRSSRLPPPTRLEEAPRRSRAGWTPSDEVRRVSLEPSDRAASGEDRFEDAVRPDSGDSSVRSFDRSVSRVRQDDPERPQSDLNSEPSGRQPEQRPPVRLEESPDLDPSDFPLPLSAISEEPSAPARSAPTEERPGDRLSPRQAPRPVDPTPPRTTADSVPTVRRFEPESRRGLEEPDPPLLMTDTPPETDDEPEPDTRPDSDPRSWLSPGSMRLSETPAAPSRPIEPEPASPPEPEPASEASEPPAPAPAPPEPEPSAEGPDELDEFPLPDPSESLSGSTDRETSREANSEDEQGGPPLDSDPFFDVPTMAAERAAPEAESGWPIDQAEAADELIEDPLDSEGSGRVRWADLPPPSPLERDVEGDTDPDDPEAEGGRGKWARGLLKWASRDRETSDQEATIVPVAQFDTDRGRLDDFVLPDLNGQSFRLREAESDFVLLCFWGTWCDPCVAAMPHLANLQRQFGPNRLRVVSIAYQRNGEGGPRSLSRVSRRLGLNYPILLAPTDTPCPVADAMEVQYYPTLILLDREGRVVHRETGATGDKLMRLDRAIAAAMDESVMTVTKR